jgi:hypothetical protein
MILRKNNRIVRTVLTANLVVLCVLLCGCNGKARPDPVDEGKMNAALINTFNDTAMENAIIAQHTLYPYHFVNDSDQLNDLGKRDLSILARHLKDIPGPLNVSSDGSSDKLYNARVAYVGAQLKKNGVDLSKVVISDGLPGGSGMPSSDVAQIREADRKARNAQRSSYPQVQNESVSSQ